MSIRIERNEAGNSVVFHGSTQPVYFNACLSGEVNEDDANAVNVKNDIRTNIAKGQDHYEFYQIPYTEFVDADGNGFADAQACADYITAVCHVIGESGNGVDLTGESMCFKLDDTHTSVMTDHGYHYGVNTIKAVLADNGLIEIVSNDHSNSLLKFRNLDPANVCINDASVAGGPQDVVNALNELFTVGAFESVVISDPYSTMVADVAGVDISYTLEGTTAVDPIGDDIFGNSSSGNYAGLKSVETIDQAGEYFTFDIRNEGQIGFGLIHSDTSYADGHYVGSSVYADPAQFAVGNSAHYGFQFSHWFHPTPNGSWTNYGASTGFVTGSGWSNWDQKQDWLDGNPVKIRVGLDENGFIAISSLQNDGTFVMHARSSYPVPQGAEFHLGIKAANSVPRVYFVPHVHLLEPAAPIMGFRYIESPDGAYTFPLFATEEEADYYELTESGSDNGSVAMVFEDDAVPGTTWYMPATSNQQQYGLTPIEDGLTTFQSNPINWTEISSLTNTQMVPEAYTAQTVTVNELSSVNIQTQPQDTGYITTFQNVPAGLLDLGDGSLIGTAPEVTGDNVANPSDDYSITVTRTNNYGSSTGTLTLTVTNLTAPVVVPITGFTHEATSTALVDADTMDAGSVVSIDETVNTDKRFIIPKTWVESYVLPALQGAGDHVILGIATGSPNWADGADSTDYNLAIKWEYASASSHTVSLIGTSTTTYTVASLTSSIFDYAIEVDTSNNLWAIGCNVNSINNEPAVADGGSFTYTQAGTSGTAPYTLHLGVVDSQMDLSATELTEIDVPVTNTMLTTWSKALDFSGSSERAQQANSSSLYTPLKMGGTNNQVAVPTAGQTVSNGHPWATAVMFQHDGHASNQHIWNLGEGAGSTDDNIYLRVQSNQQIYFGWGRDGDLNECQIGFLSSGTWAGIYVASNGARFGSGCTAAQLATAFDIRLMVKKPAGWELVTPTGFSTSNIASEPTRWTTTGGRMNREYQGDMTIGGRGANRSFHGKIASFVSTTLRVAQAMPSDAEIEEMITDPVGWVEDYKVGNPYRLPSNSSADTNNFTRNTYNSGNATQVWLMGDGTADSYANMIRSYIYPVEQNRYKLNMISMVSNDIQNVTIDGLS